MAGSTCLSCSTLKTQKTRRGLTNHRISIAINGWTRIGNLVLCEIKLSLGHVWEHICSVPLKGSTCIFMAPPHCGKGKLTGTSLWPSISQDMLVRFCRNIWEMLPLPHLVYLLLSLQTGFLLHHLQKHGLVSFKIHLNTLSWLYKKKLTLKYYKNHTWVHSYHALLHSNKEEPTIETTWIDSRALGWVKKSQCQKVIYCMSPFM